MIILKGTPTWTWSEKKKRQPAVLGPLERWCDFPSSLIEHSSSFPQPAASFLVLPRAYALHLFVARVPSFASAFFCGTYFTRFDSASIGAEMAVHKVQRFISNQKLPRTFRERNLFRKACRMLARVCTAHMLKTHAPSPLLSDCGQNKLTLIWMWHPYFYPPKWWFKRKTSWKVTMRTPDIWVCYVFLGYPLWWFSRESNE